VVAAGAILSEPIVAKKDEFHQSPCEQRRRCPVPIYLKRTPQWAEGHANPVVLSQYAALRIPCNFPIWFEIPPS
jgi:hypothetical protein